MKKCCKCKAEKDESEFYIDKRNKDGLYVRCKKCHNHAVNLWKKQHRDRSMVYEKKWRKKNWGHVLEMNRKWRKDNPEKMRLIHQKKRKNNPEKAREINRRWKKRNPDKVRADNKRWAINNRIKRRESVKRYQKNNPAKVKEFERNKAEKLTPGYIKQQLKKSGYTEEEIKNMPALFEKKKLDILIRRTKKIIQHEK